MTMDAGSTDNPNAANLLMSLAEKASEHASSDRKNTDAPQNPITPSPTGDSRARNESSEGGHTLSVQGQGTHPLYTSPIKISAAAARKAASPRHYPPYPSDYNPAFMWSPGHPHPFVAHPYYPPRMSPIPQATPCAENHLQESPPRDSVKRAMMEDRKEEASPKRARAETAESPPRPREILSDALQEAESADTQPIISPASSNDRNEEEEEEEEAAAAAKTQPQTYMPYPPPHHFMGPPFGPPPGYPPYPPHPGAHLYYPPPPPPHFYGMPYHYRPMYPPGMPQPPQQPTSNGEALPGKSKSSAEVAAGHSLQRCIQLKPPIPGRYWGSNNAFADIKLPDFSTLVNYPDYLARGRADKHPPDGQRRCVMCGQTRLCSAAGSAASAANKDDSVSTLHIIPRQNKGVCTACDVAVWQVVGLTLEPGNNNAPPLEIKWCKGCKNFRSWAAFGDKGLATKCVRCRTRQKQKYAMQKSVNGEEKKDGDDDNSR